MFCDPANSSLQSKLAARKLIAALSSYPEELMRYLVEQEEESSSHYGEPSILSKTADPSVLAALRILKLFYDKVKKEVSSASELSARESNALRFLQSIDDEETCRDLVFRYASTFSPKGKKNWNRKNWQEINVNEKAPRKKVPSSVPPFGRDLEGNAESDDSTITEKNVDRKIIEVSGSSLSSSSIEDVLGVPSERRNIYSNRQVSPKQRVDRSCSPIMGFESPESPHRQYTVQSLQTSQEPTSLISMGVQTDAIRVDASTRTHFNNGSSLNSTPNSTDKTSGSKTSSSVFSSEHSIGQVSMNRAAFLTSRANFRVVTICRDGSVCVQPTFKMPYPLNQPAPGRQPTTIRDLAPQEDDEGTFHVGQNPSSFQRMVGSSSESPLAAQEQSIISSNASRTRVSDVAENLLEEKANDEKSGTEEEEDVSTLNQISPLPTG